MKFLKTLAILSLFILLLTISCGGSASNDTNQTSESADLVLRGGKIATVDQDFTIRQAVAVKSGKIVFVGGDAGVETYIGPNTKIIELQGKLVLPGMIDCQGHMHTLGDKLTQLDIDGTRSFQEIIDIVAEMVKTAPPGQWIIGGRWDQTLWEAEEFPVHDRLSAVTPDNPVFLYRVDGHAGLANAAALAKVGISKETPKPFGGVIVRKANGEPTGLLINRALTMLEQHLPVDSEEQYQEKFLRAVDLSLKGGLTGWHEANVTGKQIEFYKRLIDQNLLKMRIYGILGEQENLILSDLAAYINKYKLKEYGNYRLSVRCIKMFLDGSLGSRGAALFESYADDPNNTGLLRVDPEYIYKVAQAALQTGIGVTTNCIGPRANWLCLNAYEKALTEIPLRDHRFRIEHAQIVRPEDIARFGRLGIIPSMRPSHCTADMRFVETRIGPERAADAYAWRSFLEAGCIIPFGSDFPVVSNNPMLGIYAAITRQDAEGEPQGGWYGAQKMTIEEAIKGHTIWAAYSAFQEAVLGSIETGKLADMVVLDKNILEIEPKEILTTQVLYTIVGGEIVYKKNN